MAACRRIRPGLSGLVLPGRSHPGAPSRAHRTGPGALPGAAPLALALTAALAFGFACGGGKAPAPPLPPSVVGSARVTWSLISTTGTPLSCQQARVIKAKVSVGGGFVEVACGADQSATFDGLTAGAYPITVELLVQDGSIAQEMFASVTVVAGEVTPIALTFTIQLAPSAAATLQLAWTIDGSPPTTGCDQVGATTVHAETLTGSIGTFSATVSCTAGVLTEANLQPGIYGIVLTLLDASNQTLATGVVSAVTAVAGRSVAPDPVDFGTVKLPPAAFLGRWTVRGSTSAVSGCRRSTADGVVIKAFPVGQSVPTFTTSVACGLGQLRIASVAPGPRPQLVVFQLYQDFFTVPPVPILLTSTTVQPVFFVRGKTATVSVDLEF